MPTLYIQRSRLAGYIDPDAFGDVVDTGEGAYVSISVSSNEALIEALKEAHKWSDSVTTVVMQKDEGIGADAMVIHRANFGGSLIGQKPVPLSADEDLSDAAFCLNDSLSRVVDMMEPKERTFALSSLGTSRTGHGFGPAKILSWLLVRCHKHEMVPFVKFEGITYGGAVDFGSIRGNTQIRFWSLYGPVDFTLNDRVDVWYKQDENCFCAYNSSGLKLRIEVSFKLLSDI